MPDLILQVWKLVFLALLYLFFIRVMRLMWTTMRPSRRESPTSAQQLPATKKPRSGLNRLIVIDPPEKAGQSFAIIGELTIGRASGCHICIEDSFMSQLHARVFVNQGAVMLEDIGSTNGTYLNGSKVTRPAQLKKGDRIKVGATTLEVAK